MKHCPHCGTQLKDTRPCPRFTPPGAGGDVVMGDKHTVYDQRGQQVGTQINVAGDYYAAVTPERVDEATLAAAQERLAALPLDHIPDPSPLPAGSRMVLSPDPLFVGREGDLKRLAQALEGGQTTAIGQIAAVTGLGGIGKTQLAGEFAHRPVPPADEPTEAHHEVESCPTPDCSGWRRLSYCSRSPC